MRKAIPPIEVVKTKGAHAETEMIELANATDFNGFRSFCSPAEGKHEKSKTEFVKSFNRFSSQRNRLTN